ncbi:MAG: hypothetical protein WAQ52_12625 [Terriglobales bacterium]
MSFSHFIRVENPVVSTLVGRVSLGAICFLAAWVSPCRAEGGFNGSLEAPEAEVLKAVHLVVNDPVVYGTYSYEKEKQLKGAKPAASVNVFGDAPDEGKLFFKVAENVLAPRHFKETADLGTIYVRYIVQGTGPGTTAIRIDATYVEKNRRRQHPSDGTVEESEFQAIKDRLEKIQAEEKPPEQSAAERSGAPAPGIASGSASEPGSRTFSSAEELEKHVADLRHRVEVRTAARGAALKSAPYRTAATLQPLSAQAELLVVVLTKYWYGVETTDGHRGWVHRSQVEPLP